MDPIAFHLDSDAGVEAFEAPLDYAVLPRTLLLHPRGFPAVGTDIEVVYQRALDRERTHRVTTPGVVAYEARTGWLAHLHPRGLIEDDPYLNMSDLIKVYRFFGNNLDIGDARRTEILVIGQYIEIFWIRQERRLRKALLLPPVK